MHRRKSFSFDSNMATMAMDVTNNDKATMTMRLATSKDVFAIIIFARELADFEKLAHICEYQT
jgi:hypothetical protein